MLIASMPLFAKFIFILLRGDSFGTSELTDLNILQLAMSRIMLSNLYSKDDVSKVCVFKHLLYSFCKDANGIGNNLYVYDEYQEVY